MRYHNVWLQAKSEAEAAKAAVRAAVGSSKAKQGAASSLLPPTAASNGANGSNGSSSAASAAAAWQPQYTGGQGVVAPSESAGASTAGSGSGSGSSNGSGNGNGNGTRRVKGSTCSACGSPDHQVLPHPHEPAHRRPATGGKPGPLHDGSASCSCIQKWTHAGTGLLRRDVPSCSGAPAHSLIRRRRRGVRSVKQKSRLGCGSMMGHFMTQHAKYVASHSDTHTRTCLVQSCDHIDRHANTTSRVAFERPDAALSGRCCNKSAWLEPG